MTSDRVAAGTHLIVERSGDLFAQSDLPAIGHGCNASGVMGAGIAKEFRNRWPGMYEQYRRECLAGWLTPGGCLPYVLPGGRVIYNLITQDRPGRYARLGWIHLAVSEALEDAADRGIAAVGLPRVGCGIGGLAFPAVQDVLERAVVSYPSVRLVVVSPPV